MIKMFLIFTWTMSNGYVHGDEYPVTVQSVKECESMGEQVLKSNPVIKTAKNVHITHMSYKCLFNLPKPKSGDGTSIRT